MENANWKKNYTKTKQNSNTGNGKEEHEVATCGNL
jgi:hypothetical protein